MTAIDESTVWTAYVAGGTLVAIGDVMVLNSAGTYFVKATTANLAAAGRDASCIARTAYSGSDVGSFRPQIVGLVAASITGLGAGTASAINVSSTGVLQRCANSASDIVGKCDTDGVAYIDFSMPWDAVVSLAGGALSVPATGIVTSNGSALSSFAPGTGVQTFLTTPSSANLASAVTDETGSGALVFASTPTLVTPVIGAATGTSAALSSYWSTGATPASLGAGRLSNNTTLTWRNAGNTADIVGITVNGTNTVQIGGINNSGITVSCANAGTFTVNADQHQLNSQDGNTLFLGVTSSSVNVRPPTISWDELTASPTIKQTTTNTNSATGQTLTVQAQNCTGTSTTGGGLIVTTGTGTTTAGTFVLQTGGTVKMIVTPTTTTFSSNATMVNAATSLQATGNAVCKVYSDIANVQTTDATVTSAFTWTITDEAATMVTVEACAVQSTGATTASYVRRVRIKRDGGTVTVGSVTDVSTDEEAGFATCDITIDNSGSTGRVRVTGVAATTIDWGVVVTRMEVAHA